VINRKGVEEEVAARIKSLHSLKEESKYIGGLHREVYVACDEGDRILTDHRFAG
jgi:hypothetical protein